ncbi:MAG: phosphatase PAP2 family protein [Myxococcales bacterium]|nr:phosphatase PAP2 family protein [Myxococcales bacterium]
MLPFVFAVLSLLAPVEGDVDGEPEQTEVVTSDEPAPEPEPAPEYAAAPTAAPAERATLPDIRFRVAIDVPILVGFSSVFFVTEGFKRKIAPQTCRWCIPGPAGRGVRDALVWKDPEAAALTSDIVAYAGIPAVALTLTLVGVGTEGQWRRIHEDLLVALEAVAVSGALTNVIKFSTARLRPYAYYEPVTFDEDPDHNLSFPSGHTSLAFAMATSFATVATMRRRKLAPVFWGLGVPMAGLVGYLRMAGDRHWLGDVLTGAGLGTLVGVGLPWLLHHPRTGVIPRASRRESSAVSSLMIMPTGNGVVVAGRW